MNSKISHEGCDWVWGIGIKGRLEGWRSKLGFKTTYTGGGDGDGEDLWGIVERDAAGGFLDKCCHI